MTTPTPPRRPLGFKHLDGLPIATVVFTDNTPTSLTYRNRTWEVVTHERWHGRAKWWENSWSPREVLRVDVPMFRVQVRLGPRSQLVTLDLSQDRTGAWKVVTVDGERPSP